MTITRVRDIDRVDNNITIHKMSRPACVSDFIRIMYDGMSRGYTSFNVTLENPGIAVYPNTCVPIAGLLEYYQQSGITFNIDIPKNEYLHTCAMMEPLYLSADEIASLETPFDRVYKYNSSAQVAAFTQKCVDAISQQVVCEEGIFDSLVWCINEVMDNVLVHSESSFGYVMAQLHTHSKHIAICISDTGIGIYNSLKGSTHHPRSSIDALTLAIQEGVGDGQGQGNGLFGLSQIIKSNRGRLSLTSGPACLNISEDANANKLDRLPYVNKEHHGTIVDFQLDLNNKVDIYEAFSSIGGFDGFDIRIDDMLQDDDSLLYSVYEHCRGTATREAGRLLRNDILNTINRAKTRIVLDFTGITTVSSSFIDEMIAKLMLDLGLIRFNQVVSIKGMNDTIRFLCERSSYMRIYEEWKNSIAMKKESGIL